MDRLIQAPGAVAQTGREMCIRDSLTDALNAQLDLGRGSGPLDHTLGGVGVENWMHGVPDAVDVYKRQTPNGALPVRLVRWAAPK